MKPYDKILREIPLLHEYQQKQLAMILISKTLNAQSNLETFKIIAKDEQQGTIHKKTARNC